MKSNITSPNWRAHAVLILCVAVLHLVKPNLASAQTGYPAIDAQLDGVCNNDPGTLIGVFLDADCTREYVLSGDALWLFLWIPDYALSTAEPYTNSAIALTFDQIDGSCDSGIYDVNCYDDMALGYVNNIVLPAVTGNADAAISLALWAAGLGTGVAMPYVNTVVDLAFWAAFEAPGWALGLGTGIANPYITLAANTVWNTYDTAYDIGDWNNDGAVDARDVLQFPVYGTAGYGYTQQEVNRYCVDNYNLTGCAIAHSLAPTYIAMEQHARSVPASDTNGDGATDTGEVAAYWTTNSEAVARAVAAHNTYGLLGYGNTQAFVDHNCGVTGESFESQHCLYSQAVAPSMMVAEHTARTMPELDDNGDGFATYDEVAANGDAAVSAQAQLLALQAAEEMEENGAPLTAQAIRNACNQPGAGTAELATSGCTAVIALAPTMFAVERTESQLVDSGVCEEGQSTEDCTASQLEPGEPMNFDEHRSLFGDGNDAATIPSVLHITGNGAIDALNALAANDAPGAAVSVAVAYQALLDYSLAYGSVYEILSVPAQVIQDTLTP